MPMDLPSGLTFNEDDLALVRMLGQYGYVTRLPEPVKLKSGIMSRIYVLGRQDMTDHPDLVWAIGQRISRVVRQNTQPGDKRHCLIGVPYAGIAPAVAGSLVDHALHGNDPSTETICFRIMRHDKKDHGVHGGWVDGKYTPDMTFWPVDNVITDGGSKFVAAARMEEDGYPSHELPSLIFIDRQQGGVRRLHEAGFKRVVTAFNLLDLTHAYVQLGIWPADMADSVAEEIAAHQF